jgi:hypothetical protein
MVMVLVIGVCDIVISFASLNKAAPLATLRLARYLWQRPGIKKDQGIRV